MMITYDFFSPSLSRRDASHVDLSSFSVLRRVIGFILVRVKDMHISLPGLSHNLFVMLHHKCCLPQVKRTSKRAVTMRVRENQSRAETSINFTIHTKLDMYKHYKVITTPPNPATYAHWSNAATERDPSFHSDYSANSHHH